jgi:hypothetical protein
VPGATPSEFYKIRVRSEASKGEWQPAFALITFQNITAEAKSIHGLPEIFHGCQESPWSGITFENVVVGSEKIDRLEDFAQVNDYVKDITFK